MLWYLYFAQYKRGGRKKLKTMETQRVVAYHTQWNRIYPRFPPKSPNLLDSHIRRNHPFQTETLWRNVLGLITKGELSNKYSSFMLLF